MVSIDPDAFGVSWIAARSVGSLPVAQTDFGQAATFDGQPIADWLRSAARSDVTLVVERVYSGPTGLNVLYRSSDHIDGIDSFMFGPDGRISSGWTTR